MQKRQGELVHPSFYFDNFVNDLVVTFTPYIVCLTAINRADHRAIPVGTFSRRLTIKEIVIICEKKGGRKQFQKRGTPRSPFALHFAAVPGTL